MYNRVSLHRCELEADSVINELELGRGGAGGVMHLSFTRSLSGGVMHLSFTRSLFFLLSKARVGPFFFRSSSAHMRHNSGITYLATLEYPFISSLSIKSCAAHLTCVDEAVLTAFIIIHNL